MTLPSLSEFFARCEKCGCTEQNSCYDEATGHGCSWARRPATAAPGLCSVCARPVGLVTHAQAMATSVRRAIAEICDRSFLGTTAKTPIARKLTPVMQSMLTDTIARDLGVVIPLDRWSDMRTVGDVITFVHDAIRQEYSASA
jgi:hypothetical protein